MRYVIVGNEIVTVRRLVHEEADRLGMFDDDFDMDSLTYHEKSVMRLIRHMDAWFDDVMNRAFDSTYE